MRRHPPTPRLQRVAAAFTAIEVSVVFLLLMLLAGLAYASLGGVVDRFNDEAVETQFAAIVRNAQALALSRADGTITAEDFERAIADTPTSAAETLLARAERTNRWTLVADPADPATPLADDEMRIAFDASRRHASAVVSLGGSNISMAHVPASGVISLRSVDRDEVAAPTAAVAMDTLAPQDVQATLAYGEEPETTDAEQSSLTAPAPLPSSPATSLLRGTDPYGVVGYLGTRGGTAAHFTNPATEGLLTVRTTPAAGTSTSTATLVDQDPQSALVVPSTEAPAQVTVDTTDRARLVVDEVAVTAGDTTLPELELSVSSDGATFAVVATTVSTDQSGRMVLTVELPDGQDPPAARFVRLRGPAGAALAVAEVELYGVLFEDTPLLPAAPQSLYTELVDAPEGSDVAVSWSTVPGASHYQLLRDGTLVAEPTTPSHLDRPPTGTYTYTVRAVVDTRAGLGISTVVNTATASGEVAAVLFDANSLSATDGAAVPSWSTRAGDLTVSHDRSTARYHAEQGPAGGAAVVFSGGPPLTGAPLATAPATWVALLRWDGQRSAVAGLGDDLAWVVGSDGRTHLRADGRTVASSTTALSPGSWQTVGLRITASGATLWVGNASTSTPLALATGTATPLHVGGVPALGLHGALAHLSIHDRALSDSEVVGALDQLQQLVAATTGQ